MKGKKVFVGLSGGVDSAVSAYLLKKKGYDVTGVFIKVWEPDFLPCSWREERRDAMRVAAHLDISFLFFNFEDEYKKEVADYMIEEYKAGRTPNPDVLCNRVVKFGSFWRKAKEMGADFIATGHYAQNIQKDSNYQLQEGHDSMKDQSYFLWMLNQSDLEHILFPIGNLEKNEVRKIAEQNNIPVAQKKDSQGICFIGDISLEEFLSHFVKSETGKVLNLSGEEIGLHRGSIYYTIGERRGFEIVKKSPEESPYFVISKDLGRNTITVSNNESEILNSIPRKIIVENLNQIIPIKKTDIEARIRYRQEKIKIKFKLLDEEHAEIEFIEPQKGLSFGQSIVFYYKEVCLGGGIMKSEID